MPTLRHGTVQNIYRIVNDGQDDLDLTRDQAVQLYHDLYEVLFPKPTPLLDKGQPEKRKKRQR